MSGFVLLVTVFAVTFVAELPDKSLFASLALSTRFRPAYVWFGVAAAFTVHVALAATAGGLLTLAPHSVVEGISAALFLGGAVWMLRGEAHDEQEPGLDAAGQSPAEASMRRAVTTSFVVVFIGEWGDITQITTANFVARYDSPLLVGIGALAALWAVSALAVFGGAKLLERVPVRWVRVVGALALTGFGVYSLIQAVGR
ncbi:MAG TPA: TMEM165/GDT1 family protein [Streptosporangiaceae bacterium]|jgi:putative Ca2+/H+ antiporter (TMEM165/GDT1 family)